MRPEKFTRGFEHREAYTELLKRHWNYDAFRKFFVYNLQKLDDGIKSTFAVSQEQIISDIVAQVELCMDGGNFRDVFVTAPTGAGKSVIFQVPAIYLAEKYRLLTLVISPLIGLMTDQVKNLTPKNYQRAETINSDISPLLKNTIPEKVSSGACDILYLSPETLLSRSDLEQLIGDRTVGMVVIDEAHIVTTWGKQFCPDYRYLGDHIRKLRKVQRERKGHSFVVATFTATAIYRGEEDMYDETINSLHLSDPITYLGYVKRESYEKFLSGEKPVMLATKAFGMGIDIDDIEIVMHFALTGNVCDYVQEIGRAARKKIFAARPATITTSATSNTSCDCTGSPR